MLEHKPQKLENELCFAIYSAQKSYNKFYAEALKKFELTYPQYITLLILWESKESMIIKNLGERLGLDTGTLTPLLKRMENEGWIIKKRDTVDGRKVYLQLTPKSLKLENEIKGSVSSCFNQLGFSSQKEYDKNVEVVKNITRLMELKN